MKLKKRKSRNEIGQFRKGKSGNTKGRGVNSNGQRSINLNYWLKKRLKGPPSKRGEKFESLEEELADILLSKALKNGNVQWFKMLLSRTDDRKLTRVRMYDIIEFIYIIVARYVKDRKDREAIFEEFRKKLIRFNPKKDVEDYFK